MAPFDSLIYLLSIKTNICKHCNHVHNHIWWLCLCQLANNAMNAVFIKNIIDILVLCHSLSVERPFPLSSNLSSFNVRKRDGSFVMIRRKRSTDDGAKIDAFVARLVTLNNELILKLSKSVCRSVLKSASSTWFCNYWLYAKKHFSNILSSFLINKNAPVKLISS